MAEVQWIKLYVSMFDNKKIKYIRTLPEGTDILLTWIMLLSSAGRCNSNGYIFLTENIPYTPEILANEFELPLNTIKLALATFQNLNMVNIDEQGILITNWSEYQSIDGLDKIKEQNRLRATRYRENHKLLNESNVTDNVNITHSNGIEEDKEEEIEKDKNKKKITYAEFVSMTEEEYNKLINEYGQVLTNQFITTLDNYKGANGKKYKSDYRAILNWVVEKVKTNQPKTTGPVMFDMTDM